MLLMHALPVEGSIAKRIGLTWMVTLLLRVGGGFVFALLLNAIYTAGGWLQNPNRISLPTLPQPQTLVCVLRLLRYCHIERLIGYALSPLLRLLGISERAVNITLIGLTLGLAYGGGLLIKEADKGNLSKHDLFSAICLLSLSHSVIEDTFTAVIIAILTRWAKTRSQAFSRRYLIK